MTGPVARVHDLAGETIRLATLADALDGDGMHDAATAARDRALAAGEHARKVARESGNYRLASLLEES